MVASDVPEGWLFSEIYLPQPEGLADDTRMRRRLSAAFKEIGLETALVSAVNVRLGIDVPAGSYGYRWNDFFRDVSISDLLDVITLVWRVYSANDRGKARPRAPEWVKAVALIFHQQGVRYSIDQLGGVHFFHDRAMEALRSTAVKGLGSPRYKSVEAALQSGLAALDGAEQHPARAIREVFIAVEELFKIMFPDAKRLVGFEIDERLKPAALESCGDNAPALDATKKLIDALKNWVSAAHNYRHAQGEADPIDPPLHLTIWLVTDALNWLRWLVAIDAKINP